MSLLLNTACWSNEKECVPLLLLSLVRHKLVELRNLIILPTPTKCDCKLSKLCLTEKFCQDWVKLILTPPNRYSCNRDLVIIWIDERIKLHKPNQQRILCTEKHASWKKRVLPPINKYPALYYVQEPVVVLKLAGKIPWHRYYVIQESDGDCRVWLRQSKDSSQECSLFLLMLIESTG
jgi:hypothetical protein